jgi:excisionase family DNA binding protein
VAGDSLHVNQTEAAAMLGIDQRTFVRWWRKGDIPIQRFKKGRVVRFLRSDVQAFANAYAERPPGFDNKEEEEFQYE